MLQSSEQYFLADYDKLNIKDTQHHLMKVK